MNLSERIQYIRKYNIIKPNISENEFAKSVGTYPAKFAELRSGKTKSLPSNLVLDISKKYGYSFKWIMTGEGEMYAEETNKLPIDAIRGKYAIGMPSDEIMKLVGPRDFINIPVYGDVSASMGYGITVYDEKQTATYAISKELARDLGIQKLDSKMIFAQGDSMEPTIIGGDSLLVDTSKKEVYDGKIYCVRIDGQLYAKRLQKIPPNKVRVISDNRDKYEPLSIDLKNLDFDFEIIGEVKWWGRVAK